MTKRWLCFLFSFLLMLSPVLAEDEDEDEAAPAEKTAAAPKGEGTIFVSDVKLEAGSGDVKAVAEISINGVVKIKDIKVLKNGELNYPAYVSRGGKEYPQFEPLTKQAKDAIETAIKSKKPSPAGSKAISYKITEFKSLRSKSRKANAKITLNNSVEISCGVMAGKKGPWISWPAVKDESTGKYNKQVIFTNKKLKDTIEKALLAKLDSGGDSGDEEE